MKRIFIICLLVLTALPVFSGWCYKTQSVKDNFGDEIRKDDYYLYDDYIHDDCNKFIMAYFDGDNFLNGYISFTDSDFHIEKLDTVQLNIKEENGRIVTFSCQGENISGVSNIIIKNTTMKKLIGVFSSNRVVKLVVSKGNSRYNFGEIDCSSFVDKPRCIKDGHIVSQAHICKRCGRTVNGSILPGVFSVSPTKKVRFSSGNLYWNGSQFKFEDNQYEFAIEWNPLHVSHFYMHDSEPYSENPPDRYYDKRAIEKNFFNTEKSFVVDSENGPRKFFLLTEDELCYMLNERKTTENLRNALVKVNGIYGVMIFPDEFVWKDTMGSKPIGSCSNLEYIWRYEYVLAKDGLSNLCTNYSLSEFSELESAGCVFLPCAGGRRDKVIIAGVNELCYYYFGEPKVAPETIFIATKDLSMCENLLCDPRQDYEFFFGVGFSVRLCTDAKPDFTL